MASRPAEPEPLHVATLAMLEAAGHSVFASSCPLSEGDSGSPHPRGKARESGAFSSGNCPGSQFTGPDFGSLGNKSCLCFDPGLLNRLLFKDFQMTRKLQQKLSKAKMIFTVFLIKS